MKRSNTNSKSLIGVFLIAPLLLSTTASASSIDVGPDQVITLADSAFLDGLVTDSGFPSSAPRILPVIWSKISGPGTVTFGNNKENLTTATFSSSGTYVLRLTIAGSNTKDDVSITVNTSIPNTIRVPEDYSSIQKGIDAANTGDLVLVSPGTYTENLSIKETITLASTFYTTGDTDLIDQTIIKSPSIDTAVITISGGVGPETQVTGFTIKSGSDGIKTKRYGRVKVVNNRFFDQETDSVDFSPRAGGLVQNNTMEGAGDDAVDIDDSSVLIDNNVMHNNGEGVEIRAKTVTDEPQLTIIIRNNEIKNSNKTGLQLIDNEEDKDITETAGLLIIDHNLIINSGASALAFMAGSDTSDKFEGASLLERVHLYNNTFIGNRYGISGGDNVIALNNIFVDTKETAINEVNGDSIVAYNLFWNNGRNDKNSHLNSTGSIFASPLFNSKNELQQGSPAIDSGISVYSLTNGETILNLPSSAYFGASPDLGVFESNYNPGENAPPNAKNDSASTNLEETITINVADNDTDPDGNLDENSATFTCDNACNEAQHGSLTKQSNGSIRYTPESGFTGTDQFVYEICDTEGLCDTATVTINVINTHTNTPPIAQDDTSSIFQLTNESEQRLIQIQGIRLFSAH